MSGTFSLIPGAARVQRPIAAEPAEPAEPAPGLFQQAYPEGLPADPPAVSPAPATEVLPSPLDAPEALPAEIQRLSAPVFSFLTGPAGCGKTYLARQWAQSDPGVLICATTGIAAVNLGDAVTVNATLKYFNTESLQEAFLSGWLQARLRKLRAAGVTRYVLDEVSMLGAEALTVLVDAVEELNDEAAVELGDEPRIGLTLVGDFLQLPPVQESYAFTSPRWDRFDANQVTLTGIRRQADPAFIEALRALRVGDAAAALPILAPRLVPAADSRFEGTTILAKNVSVDRFNRMRHESLPPPVLRFAARQSGEPLREWDKIPQILGLKRGALVMILANKYEGGLGDMLGGLEYANGDLGILVDGDPAKNIAQVQLQRTGGIVTVVPTVKQNLEPTGAKGKKADRYRVLGEIEYLPLRLAYASTVHKCCTGDTRIRRGAEIVTLSEIRPGDALHVGGYVWERADTMETAYRLRTRRRYEILASANHRWLTTRGWATTREIALQPEHFEIALARGTPLPAKTPYAWWLGATVGNGTYTDRRGGQLHFATTHTLLGDRWGSIALDLGARRVSWRKDRRGLHTTSVRLRERLEADGLGYTKGPQKYIPECIWRGGPAAWTGFLQGLFDTDGSVGRSFVVWTTASERLSAEVHELLLAVGVVAKRQVYRGARAPYWQVRIAAAGLPAFRSVGFSHPEKAERLAQLAPNRVIVQDTGFDRVVAVDAVGLQLPMVDLEVSAPHVIATGPFLSHNSQGLTLDQVQVDIGDRFFRSPAMTYVALSRARSLQGLRLVGTAGLLKDRCTVAAEVRPWA